MGYSTGFAEIVKPRVRIVVIPPIPEGIKRADNPLLNRCRARLGGNRAVAPCVIGIRAYLGSVFRVDGDDAPLQVLLKVVGVKRIRSIGLVSVLQPDGSAVLVIEIHKEEGSELFGCNAEAVQDECVLISCVLLTIP